MDEDDISAKIDATLKMNQGHIRKLILDQYKETFDPEIESFRALYQNLELLGTLADRQPDTRFLLGQIREPLSAFHINCITEEERQRDAMTEEYITHMFKVALEKRRFPERLKKPRSECMWKPEEEQKFLEALELYGQKDLEQVAKHIGTRSKLQVRSHLQKHKLRLAKNRVNLPMPTA
jgi:SHAQKYF class myb-like DNA-binding protein